MSMVAFPSVKPWLEIEIEARAVCAGWHRPSEASVWVESDPDGVKTDIFFASLSLRRKMFGLLMEDGQLNCCIRVRDFDGLDRDCIAIKVWDELCRYESAV